MTSRSNNAAAHALKTAVAMSVRHGMSASKAIRALTNAAANRHASSAIKADNKMPSSQASVRNATPAGKVVRVAANGAAAAAG